VSAFLSEAPTVNKIAAAKRVNTFFIHCHFLFKWFLVFFLIQRSCHSKYSEIFFGSVITIRI
jgi:hypothetical protein